MIVETGGVGYRVIVVPQVLNRVQDGHVAMFTYLKVSETELTLFGLPDPESLKCLEQLITVSGVGPKLAMTILSFGDQKSIYSAITQGEIDFFTRMSGVGKKTAERIIVELKDKVTGGAIAELGHAQSEVAHALESLGYQAKAIREVLGGADQTKSIAEQIKDALKKLSS